MACNQPELRRGRLNFLGCAAFTRCWLTFLNLSGYRKSAGDLILAFRGGWRTLKPGGRAVIFDKFLPESNGLMPGHRLIGRIALRLARIQIVV
ncbi:MAG: hypothetical protein L3J16_04905 [Anaerolineales bacterium]|nr:hypothetical protein [Anaerolineales bacterium]